MTYLANRAADFAGQMTEGFVAANPLRVRAVRGGVVRTTRSTTPRVAVVIGGGSGHYPAFAGLVGPGLAAGAAMGNVFASPSAAQIVSVALAADEGAGVLFSYGNYAGDVLNFDQAQEQLNAHGIDCVTVRVTDDISSASSAERSMRRGVAGGLFVYKIAGAAAAEGMKLADVASVASRANERIRTIGVAFSGCTLPGAELPLFTVPKGRMAVGMGVHGEPGLEEVDIPTADDLADLLVGRLLAEVPEGQDVANARIVVILNGLGSLKSEELFVVYRRVAELCRERGLEVVDAQVGEFVTSFEMAGLSLTFAWLDPELERLWLAPAAAPAFTRGDPAALPTVTASSTQQDVAAQVALPQSSEASRAAAAFVTQAFEAARDAIDSSVDYLGHLDSIAGDGDHGIGMQRGIGAATDAAREALDQGAGLGSLLRAGGDAWADRAGGTSGAIWGVVLNAVGDQLGDVEFPDLARVATSLRHAQNQIQYFGKVSVGDKTMLDAIVPFVLAIESGARSGVSLADAWHAATEAATTAADATAKLQPRTGRARAHGARSVGTPDPGAISFALIVSAIDNAIVKEPHNG